MRKKEKAQAQQQASDYIAFFDHYLELLCLEALGTLQDQSWYLLGLVPEYWLTLPDDTSLNFTLSANIKGLNIKVRENESTSGPSLLYIHVTFSILYRSLDTYKIMWTSSIMQNSDMRPRSQVCMCSPTLEMQRGGRWVWVCACTHTHMCTHSHAYAHVLPADAVLAPHVLNGCWSGMSGGLCLSRSFIRYASGSESRCWLPITC